MTHATANDAITSTGSSVDRIKLEPSWKRLLAGEFEQPYMRQLRDFLFREKQCGKILYPPGNEIFNAFNLTPFEQVRVVILGQDPYHGPGQAHGLCFSVKDGVPLPPSLKNIYKEISQELGVAFGNNGCLIPWARQGVLLLNSVLTVEQGQAAAHQGKGWEHFTDRVIAILNEKHEGLIFLLWGSYAQNKGKIIDSRRHRVLKSPHPSPLSAHRGFLGNGHFRKTNEFLQAQGAEPIDWKI